MEFSDFDKNKLCSPCHAPCNRSPDFNSKPHRQQGPRQASRPFLISPCPPRGNACITPIQAQPRRLLGLPPHANPARSGTLPSGSPLRSEASPSVPAAATPRRAAACLLVHSLPKQLPSLAPRAAVLYRVPAPLAPPTSAQMFAEDAHNWAEVGCTALSALFQHRWSYACHGSCSVRLTVRGWWFIWVGGRQPQAGQGPRQASWTSTTPPARAGSAGAKDALLRHPPARLCARS